MYSNNRCVLGVLYVTEATGELEINQSQRVYCRIGVCIDIRETLSGCSRRIKSRVTMAT